MSLTSVDLPGPGDPGHGDEEPERERHVDVGEVVLARTQDLELAAHGARAAYGRHGDLAAAREVLPGHRVGVVVEVLHGAAVHDLAAVLAGPRPDVDDPVGDLDGVLVVLDDDQGVAEVLEPQQGLDQPLVVALVQADRGLVEHVEDADEAGADLGGQADALGLAARQRPGGPVEGEVVEAHVEQELQALVDLLEHPLADLALAVGHVELAEELRGLVDRQRADLGDAGAPGLAVGDRGQRHRARDRLEPRAVAGGAGHLAHEALEALAAGVGLRLAVPALDVGAHALEGGVVGALAAVAVAGHDVDLARVPVEDRLARRGGQLLPGGVQVEAELAAQRTEQAQEVVGDVRVAPRLDGALPQRRRRVRHDQLAVDLHPGAQAGAGRAGAEGRVEGERARLELVDVDRVLVGAGHLLAEAQLTVLVVGRQVDEVEDHESAGEPEGGLDGVGEAALAGLLDREPVDDHLDRVLLLLVQGRRRVEGVGLAVDPGPREALGLQLGEHVDVLALATADDGREHLEAAALLEREHPVDDLLGRLPLDRRPAGGAVRAPGAGVEQAQVVVDLGDGADRGARVLRGRLLVDGDGGREPLDEVDVGLVHLAQELPGVGRQRLDVAALALGEDGVEGERGLARAGEAREDDQGVPGQVDRDVLEVVLPGAPDDELVLHEVSLVDRTRVRDGTAAALTAHVLAHGATRHRQRCQREGPRPTPTRCAVGHAPRGMLVT